MPSFAMRHTPQCAAIHLVLLCLLSMPADGKLREEQFDVPVSIMDADGRPIDQTIKLTLFSDDANPTPAPVIVFHHGRDADARDRAGMGRARDLPMARHFVAQGFIVAMPTRVGYGVSGGEDVELSGACDDKRYGPGHEAGLAQTLATLDALRLRPDADTGRVVLAGQSYGGTIAIRAAAANPPGVLAAINFAGGGGGNPRIHPQEPCGTDRMAQLFHRYGHNARVPTLWVYTRNDQYMGPRYPRQWFQAYREAGGRGEFVLFPPLGEDGHTELLGRFPVVWQPRVREFLERHGVVAERTAVSQKDVAYTRKLHRIVLASPSRANAGSESTVWGSLADALQRRGVDVFPIQSDPLELRRGQAVRELASSVGAGQIVRIEHGEAMQSFEASIVDTATRRIVWRAISKAAPGTHEDGTASTAISAALLDRLQADGLLQSPPR